MELSRQPLFRKAWNLPPYSELEEENSDEALVENSFYSKMQGP
jgi:hypothetical protein